MPPVFNGVQYHLTSTLPHERREELARTLTTHGAVPASSIATATHIIADSDTGFDGWQEVKQGKIVTASGLFYPSELWVVRSMELEKLQEPEFYSACPRKIFSGVVACAADVSRKSIPLTSPQD
ncbi:hypothetical protein FB45DRAFT_1026909 [Roridomyces roridus]|uniref:BRCT domain-containing protein n=1 Tax=Roridomyces roridus TaxID=1738132 RepID=A0AAD7BWV8_9AGAR|nr:hypothetical protein FB45DRAFT_1026909 [Roridomyces roridus]